MKSSLLTQGQFPIAFASDRAVIAVLAAMVVVLAACTVFVIDYTTVHVSMLQNLAMDPPP